MNSSSRAFASLLLLCLPISVIAEVDPELKEAVDVAFEEGEDEIAFNLILSEIQSSMMSEMRGEDHNDELVDYAIDVFTNRSDILRKRSTLTCPTVFSVEDMNIAKTFVTGSSDPVIDFMKTASDLTPVALALYLTSTNSFSKVAKAVGAAAASSVAAKAELEQKSIEFYKQSLENTFPFLDDDTISSSLKQYDAIKDALGKWIEMEMKQTSLRKNLRQHIQVKKRLDSLKETIVKERTSFLSYSVMSPILAETSRRFWLANQRFIGHDKETTQTAVEFLSKHTQANWPRECSEDVRRQWFEVLKQLKGMAGEAERQEYEALAGILKPDSDATLGGKAWWR